MSWLLLVTAIFADGSELTIEFPMANKEECRSEIEWPGNAPYNVMTMGEKYSVDCLPVGGGIRI